MIGLSLSAAVIAVVSIDGAVEMADAVTDYVIVEVEVPEGVRELEIEHTTHASDNVLDWGLWGPDGFRGWSGGLREPIVVGENEASRGYLPGPLPAGRWEIVIGLARIHTWPAAYSITVTFRDEETLSPAPRAPHAPVVLATERRWYRGDFHVHSRESGDATATLAEIAGLARERALDFVALSDHNTVSHHALMAAYQPEVDDVLLVRAVEVTTYAGHGNAFGIESYVDHRVGHEGVTAGTLAADVSAQGGLFSINHPGLELGDFCIGCAWSFADTPWQHVHAVEIHTGSHDVAIGLFTPRAIALWDAALDQGHRVTAIGGSDDHRAGIDLDPFQSPIGSPTTLVLADELSERGILDAVQAGRAIVQLRGPDDPWIELLARGADDALVELGGTVRGSAVELDVHVRGGTGLQVQIVRNGEPADLVSIEGDDWRHTLQYELREEGDRFRAHVVENGQIDLVITNHIHAEYAPPEPEPVAGGCGCQGSAPGGSALALLLVVWLALARRKRSRGLPRQAETATA